MTQRSSNTFRSGRGPWVRFAMGAGERWLASAGHITAEMQQFGTYLREMRYRQGYSIRELSDELGLAYESLLMLETGLLRPSEVTSATWVRLMRLLEGREVLVRREQPEDETDPDEAWAEEDGASAKPLGVGQALGVATLKVIGVGGGGSNAVGRMYQQRVPGVEYIAVNTDAQHLIRLDIPRKVRIGDRLTRGLGVGGNPELGARGRRGVPRRPVRPAERHGYGVRRRGNGRAGTGTGAAPVVAEIAKEVGALTIAVVTKPFGFEGQQRAMQAEEGIRRLREHVDTMILIPNDRLYTVSDERMTAENAFRIADDVLRQGVQSIAELVMVAGDINLDFADIRAVMTGAGSAWMAIGHGRGRDPRLRRGAGGDGQPLASRSGARRDPRAAEHHLRAGRHAAGSLRGVRHHPRAGRPERQHHLRHDHGREYGGRGARHRRRHGADGRRERRLPIARLHSADGAGAVVGSRAPPGLCSASGTSSAACSAAARSDPAGSRAGGRLQKTR